MAEKQERIYNMILNNLNILSPMQLDTLQHIMRNMLIDLDLESSEHLNKVKERAQ